MTATPYHALQCLTAASRSCSNRRAWWPRSPGVGPGDMRRLGGLLLVAAALALPLGCVRSTRVEVHRTGETQEVDLARRWHGVTIGPCGFVTGAYANYSIRLNGPGPVFPVEQVELLDEKGKVNESARKGLTGEVRVDSLPSGY